MLLTNVCVQFDGKRTELDNLIINRSGVYIIEVKTYRGRLFGGADDYEWEKYKVTNAGNVYEKTVKNPIKPVQSDTVLESTNDIYSALHPVGKSCLSSAQIKMIRDALD